MAKKQKKPDNVIALNKKARFDFTIEDSVEAGLVLKGSEIKALREGHGCITEAYAIFQGTEMFLFNSFIAQYSNADPSTAHDERRTRKLLLHKRQITQFQQMKEREGYTFVPLKLYWNKGKVKLELGIVKGKKQHDKRATIKERDWNRQKQRLLKTSVS